MQATTSTSSSTASSSSAAGKPDRLYVGNLSPTIDEYTLIQVFSKFGKITKLDFIFHKTGVLKGKPRGFAFIQFADKDDALKAMVKLHDRLLRGRKLVVTYASAAPAENFTYTTKGRRAEPAKTTTLSLLKTNKKPQSAAAQIAAMEAKLASMARTKPADEDYVPGGSAPVSRGETPILDEGMSNAGSPIPPLEEMLGDAEGARAADDLEKEIQVGLQSETIEIQEPSTPSVGDGAGGLPLKPDSVGSSMDDKDRKQKQKENQHEHIKRGLASLPQKPIV